MNIYQRYSRSSSHVLRAITRFSLSNQSATEGAWRRCRVLPHYPSYPSFVPAYHSRIDTNDPLTQLAYGHTFIHQQRDIQTKAHGSFDVKLPVQ
jgi:hypothetical protein